MLHVLIGQEAYLERVTNAGPNDVFRWTLPKTAQVGDMALLYFPSESAVVACAEVLTAPEPDTFGAASVYMSDIGKVAKLDGRVTLEELKVRFKDWGWPRWNPKRAEWGSMASEASRTTLGDGVATSWSCGNTKRMAPGDRLFLMKLKPARLRQTD